MIPRHLSAALLDALADTPVVLLHGARQTGKTTLAKYLCSAESRRRYFTLDDLSVLSAARQDPVGFLAGLEGPIVLDEVQRVPELFLAIKSEVDRRPVPGRFLLTGSADVLLLPRLSESLAGRMEVLTLWPLSQGEIAGTRESFLDVVFGEPTPQFPATPEERPGLLRRVLLGGYPPVLRRPSAERRKVWFESYLATTLQRDVRDLANIEDITALPRLLSLAAARSCSLLNYAELSRSIGIPQSTLKRYLTLLEVTFLVQVLPAWSANLGKRLVKSPKLLLNDTGLMAHLLGLSEERLNHDPMLLGPLLENFVVLEVRKQIAWSRTRPQAFHFRLPSGEEVDLVLEDSGGNLVGIEVKASATATAKDFKGLRALAALVGPRFRRGILLYAGASCVPFGANFHAVPVSALWHAF